MAIPLHILLLEDNQEDAAFLQAKLEHAGFLPSITVVQSEAAFTAALEHSHFDLIISDYSVPSFNGKAALKIARTISPDIPFIFLSGTIGEDAAIESLLNGATDYILKQKISRLKPAIERGLREAQERKELKQSETALHMLSKAIEQAADNVIITNHQGIIEFVNPAFELVTGYTSREVIGKTPRILKSGKHDQEFYETLWKTILSGHVFRGVLINRKKNGEFYQEEETIAPVVDDKGTISHFISTGRDITDRMVAEEALRSSEERYRTVTQTATDGIVTIDEASVILIINRA